MIRLLFIFPLFLSWGTQAQQKAASVLHKDLIQFFSGGWHGKGAFANGKVIEADVSFEIALDSSWLVYKHVDQPPNRYKAISMWGVDVASGQFLAYSFDNFHGHRIFTSNGWNQGKLLLTTTEYYPNTGSVFQQFTYEKISDNSFKITFETSRDARTWQLGDYLIFNKK